MVNYNYELILNQKVFLYSLFSLKIYQIYYYLKLMNNRWHILYYSINCYISIDNVYNLND